MCPRTCPGARRYDDEEERGLSSKLTSSRLRATFSNASNAAASKAANSFSLDTVRGDHLDVRDDPVHGAEIEHPLGLRDAADHREIDCPAVEKIVGVRLRIRVLGHSHQGQRAALCQQNEVVFEAVAPGHGVGSTNFYSWKR